MRKQLNKIYIFTAFFAVIFTIFSINSYADWQPPCDESDCTGEWQVGTETVYTPGCVTCEITIHYHFRIAYCPEEEYQFHIDYFQGNSMCYMCWAVPNNVQYFATVLNRFLISIGSELQDNTAVQLSFASCWASDMLGPFPMMQPCPNNIYCCKLYYGIENGIPYLIGADDNPENINCSAWEGHDCGYVCDPNGYLYKRNIYEETEDLDMKTSINPNPNKGNFDLSFTRINSDELFIEIFDLNGNSVFHSNYIPSIGDNTINVNLSSFIPGNYQLLITDNLKIVSSKKFIINK